MGRNTEYKCTEMLDLFYRNECLGFRSVWWQIRQLLTTSFAVGVPKDAYVMKSRLSGGSKGIARCVHATGSYFSLRILFGGTKRGGVDNAAGLYDGKHRYRVDSRVGMKAYMSNWRHQLVSSFEAVRGKVVWNHR